MPCDGGVGGLRESWAGFLSAVRARGGVAMTLPAAAGNQAAPPKPRAVAAAVAGGHGRGMAQGRKGMREEGGVETEAPKGACPAPTLGRGCRPPPAAAVIVQYYKREHNIARLTASTLGSTGGVGVLHTAPSGDGGRGGDVEYLVNNDSGSHHGKWLKAMAGCVGCFLVHSPDIHEIRGYNRLAKLTEAPLLAFIQDDDTPRNGTQWLTEAASLMAAKPELGLLGGKTGRVDPRGAGLEIKERRDGVPGYISGPTWQIDGPKFGRGHTAIVTQPAAAAAAPATAAAAATGGGAAAAAFMHVYKVNASPLVTRRALFMRVGMFHPALSCPAGRGTMCRLTWCRSMNASGDPPMEPEMR